MLTHFHAKYLVPSKQSQIKAHLTNLAVINKKEENVIVIAGQLLDIELTSSLKVLWKCNIPFLTKEINLLINEQVYVTAYRQQQQCFLEELLWDHDLNFPSPLIMLSSIYSALQFPVS